MCVLHRFLGTCEFGEVSFSSALFVNVQKARGRLAFALLPAARDSLSAPLDPVASFFIVHDFEIGVLNLLVVALRRGLAGRGLLRPAVAAGRRRLLIHLHRSCSFHAAFSTSMALFMADALLPLMAYSFNEVLAASIVRPQITADFLAEVLELLLRLKRQVVRLIPKVDFLFLFLVVGGMLLSSLTLHLIHLFLAEPLEE